MRKTHHISLGLFLALAAFFAVQCRSEAPVPDGEARTFVLEADDGRFVMDGEPNPTLRVRKDQPVRLVFRNTENGVHHAISVPPFVESSHEVDWGEEAAVTFTPDRTGTFTYRCGHHVPVMKGTLVVEPKSATKPVAKRRRN